MIIKKKNMPLGFIKLMNSCIKIFLKISFHKIVIKPIPIKSRHSYLLLCNHFSFLDGPLALHLSFNAIYPHFKYMNFMVMKKQLEKKPWLRYMGGFSVDPGKFTVAESLQHASEILSQPGNILIFYPQGNLESQHIRTIAFQEGLYEIIPKIKGDCQIIWSSNIIEYFESVKPSVYFEMLDCGTNHDFNFEALKIKVNKHHNEVIESRFRFTKES